MENNKTTISPEFAKALIKATKEMGGVKKGANNPFFKSKYADLGSVIEVVKPALINNGITYIQKLHPSSDSVMVETVLIYETGEMLSCGIVSMPMIKKDAQGAGSCVSYGRRYSLQTALGLPAIDDDGNHASGKGDLARAGVNGVDPEMAKARAEQLAKVQAASLMKWKYDLSTMPEADLVTAETWLKLNGGTLVNSSGHIWEHVRDLKNLAAYRVKM